MNACPKCGGTTGYVKALRVSGVVFEWCSWDGKVQERINGEDPLRYAEPKTVRCEYCGKRIPNPLKRP